MFTGTEFGSPRLRVAAVTRDPRYTVDRIAPFWQQDPISWGNLPPP
jgi:hypothetical protein